MGNKVPPKTILELIQMWELGFIRNSDLQRDYGISEKELYEMAKKLKSQPKTGKDATSHP